LARRRFALRVLIDSVANAERLLALIATAYSRKGPAAIHGPMHFYRNEYRCCILINTRNHQLLKNRFRPNAQIGNPRTTKLVSLLYPVNISSPYVLAMQLRSELVAAFSNGDFELAGRLLYTHRLLDRGKLTTVHESEIGPERRIYALPPRLTRAQGPEASDNG
jgi:hypothetical protein